MTDAGARSGDPAERHPRRVGGNSDDAADSAAAELAEIVRSVIGPDRGSRIAAPQKLVAVITFLISNAASFVNGNGLVADSGLTALLP